MKKIFILLFLAFTLAGSLQAQVKIGDNPATINAGSLLEMESTNKGLLYPRVDLSTLTANTLATFGLAGSSPTDGMTVFNTAVSSNFKIGLYIWQNNTWNIVNSTATPGNDKNIYEGNGTLTGNRTVNQAGRTLAFTATATNAFSVDGTTFSVDAANNGVGIGTTTPSTPLQVIGATLVGTGTASATALAGSGSLQIDGASTNYKSFDAGSSTSIDFAKSNLAFTTATPGAFTFTGLKDGGTYTLVTKSNTVGTLAPSQAGLTFKSSTNAATTVNKHTVYTFMVVGTDVYYYMTPGF